MQFGQDVSPNSWYSGTVQSGHRSEESEVLVKGAISTLGSASACFTEGYLVAVCQVAGWFTPMASARGGWGLGCVALEGNPQWCRDV